jgi:hypothetical protein
MGTQQVQRRRRLHHCLHECSTQRASYLQPFRCRRLSAKYPCRPSHHQDRVLPHSYDDAHRPPEVSPYHGLCRCKLWWVFQEGNTRQSIEQYPVLKVILEPQPNRSGMHVHRHPRRLWYGVSVSFSWPSNHIRGRLSYLNRTMQIILGVLYCVTEGFSGLCSRARGKNLLGRRLGLPPIKLRCRVRKCGVSQHVHIQQLSGLGANALSCAESSKESRRYPNTTIRGD